jgi:hypothetical protein
MVEEPANMGFPPSSSPKMHPEYNPHTSQDFLFSKNLAHPKMHPEYKSDTPQDAI